MEGTQTFDECLNERMNQCFLQSTVQGLSAPREEIRQCPAILKRKHFLKMLS